MSASERRAAELQATVERLEADNVRLRHLLGEQMRAGEQLEFTAIVNEAGKPLVDLRWDQLAAQFPVAEARELALDLLRICEWAQTDSIVFTKMRELLDEQTAGMLLAMLRESRGGRADASG